MCREKKYEEGPLSFKGIALSLGELERRRILGARPEAVERVAPALCSDDLVAQHVARYRWASKRVKDRVVADICSGTGYGSELTWRAGARWVASLDASMDGLTFGAKNYWTLPVCGDAHYLPLKAEAFDTVVSLETVEHLANPAVFAGELWRVLRAGGRLLLSTPNAAGDLEPNPFHLKEFTLDELTGLLNTAGFRIIRVKGQHWRLPFKLCQTVRGVRKLAWEFERRPRVLPRVIPGSVPRYWCIEALK